MNLDTKNEITWCPGCSNFMILNSVKKAIKKSKIKNFTMVTGIGCHAKIFDYLNISGIYGLHGRVLPTMLGIKIGNPKLNVIGFAGDGDTYSEGLSHFISAGRYNSNMTLLVHDNQSFSLTTGQVTPTSQQGFKAKSEPLGNFNTPLNPLKLALSSGITFIARCDSKDIDHTAKIIEQAIKHKGFAFVEIIQTCLIFNKEMNNLSKYTYKVNNSNMKKAIILADKWNYNSKKGKIPIGIIYKEKRKTLEENWPQLKNGR
ncbi:2-oxoacid:ferredoxin oxidoreductase subunit beta [archaeon]|nr:2-oxoacid:ferredoxin oxidoreductase subunit beta [archaeon]